MVNISDSDKTPQSGARYECLRDVLLAACPMDAFERRSIRSLAAHLDTSHQAVFYWLKAGRVPQGRAKEIIRVSEGRVTLEDLLPYVL